MSVDPLVKQKRCKISLYGPDLFWLHQLKAFKKVFEKQKSPSLKVTLKSDFWLTDGLLKDNFAFDKEETEKTITGNDLTSFYVLCFHNYMMNGVHQKFVKTWMEIFHKFIRRFGWKWPEAVKWTILWSSMAFNNKEGCNSTMESTGRIYFLHSIKLLNS